MSSPQVTITLGRSRQVVKRGGHVPESSEFNYSSPVGSKRSIRERLGNNGDTLLYGIQSRSKRQRGENNLQSSTDAWIPRNDLRFKLICKNKFRQTRGDVEDQNHLNRRKLSREIHSPVSTYSTKCLPKTKVTTPLRQIPPTRSADDLLQLKSLRGSYSDWTHDGLRCRSPDRILGASRGLSPPRNMHVTAQGSGYKPIDSPRFAPYMDRVGYDYSRPTGSVPPLRKSSLSLEASRPVTRSHPSTGLSQKTSYLGVEPLTVSYFLHSLGLEKYAVLFQAEEIDMTALKQMRDDDLRELGLPMGPRRKILLALMRGTARV